MNESKRAKKRRLAAERDARHASGQTPQPTPQPTSQQTSQQASQNFGEALPSLPPLPSTSTNVLCTTRPELIAAHARHLKYIKALQTHRKSRESRLRNARNRLSQVTASNPASKVEEDRKKDVSTLVTLLDAVDEHMSREIDYYLKLRENTHNYAQVDHLDLLLLVEKYARELMQIPGYGVKAKGDVILYGQNVEREDSAPTVIPEDVVLVDTTKVKQTRDSLGDFLKQTFEGDRESHTVAPAELGELLASGVAEDWLKDQEVEKQEAAKRAIEDKKAKELEDIKNKPVLYSVNESAEGSMLSIFVPHPSTAQLQGASASFHFTDGNERAVSLNKLMSDIPGLNVDFAVTAGILKTNATESLKHAGTKREAEEISEDDDGQDGDITTPSASQYAANDGADADTASNFYDENSESTIDHAATAVPGIEDAGASF